MAVVLVTGGASGIGAALSRTMVGRGDTVFVADVADAESFAEELSETGPGRAEFVALDVRDSAAFAAVVRNIIEACGSLDVLFNNAGIGVGGPVEELTVEHWDRVVDVNLRGVYNGISAAYPAMVAAGSGHIVNTASLAGLIPSPMLTPYAATKHAVVGLSLSLRAEAAANGVRVTVVCPGFTDTPILDSAGPEDLPKTSVAGSVRAMAAAIPGGLYNVDALAADILRGVERNDAMVVTPQSARTMWWLMRLTPWAFMKTVTAQADRSRKRLLAAVEDHLVRTT